MPLNRRVGVTRWEDVLGERIKSYWERLSDVGLEPIDLNKTAEDFDDLSGLVLTGGVDVHPSRYGEAPHPKVRFTDPSRDDFELALLQQALDRDLPVLAICRGSQLLNVAFGGSLLQHIESGEHVADYRSEDYPSRSHEIRVEEGTRLALILGSSRIVVNSRHHQAVTRERLGPGLRPLAVTEDGLVEAFESERHRWVIGVQWHPERSEPSVDGFGEASRRLFAAFSEAVG